MQIHHLIALGTRLVLHESTAAAFDLHTTPSLCLNVLHIAATGTHYLRPQIEARDRLEIDWDPLLGPLAATEGVALERRTHGRTTRSAWFVVAASESSFVDQVWERLFHELVDFGYGAFEAVFGRACYVQEEGWGLQFSSISRV